MKTKYLIGMIIAVVLAVAAVTYALQTQEPYVTFDTAVAEAGNVQVKGTWVKGSGADYDASTNEFRFTLKDEQGKVMPVILNDAKPNNFELAEQLVASGRVENGVFHASKVLTKCPSKYEADRIDT